MYLNPSYDYSISIQTSEIKHEMLSTTEINKNRFNGFKQYFKGILSIAKANNIQPITILANNDQRRDGSFAKQFSKKENIEYAIERSNNAQSFNVLEANSCIFIKIGTSIPSNS